MRERSILDIRAYPLDIAMTKAFGIAGGAQARARNVLVEIELSSGEVGYGEAAPFPAFNGETQEDVMAACDAAAEGLVGCDATAWRARAEQISDEAAAGDREIASAACALETALLDALTRAMGTSLRVFFGGAEETLVTDVTITTGTVEDAAREARDFAAFDTLKIKIGGGDLDRDVARVLAIAKARPGAHLLLDANGGLTADAAIRLATELARHGVKPDLFEQPVSPATCGGELAAWAALAEIREATGLAVAIDEMVARPEDVLRARDEDAADAVNIKIMKSGIARALDIAATARAAGMRTMIGGMVEARLAMGTSACLAAGLGGFLHVDLDTPLFLAEDPFDGGYVQDGQRLDLRPIVLGHGCIPKRR
jgi:L-alanine-DL-glutamate epimerase-like enolase superfamily enzyme